MHEEQPAAQRTEKLRLLSAPVKLLTSTAVERQPSKMVMECPEAPKAEQIAPSETFASPQKPKVPPGQRVSLQKSQLYKYFGIEAKKQHSTPRQNSQPI